MHVAVVWGLINMLDTTMVTPLIQQIQATLIEEQQQAEEEAPPPPKFDKPPPVYVPPVEIAIESTAISSTAIQAVTSDRVWPKSRPTNPRPPYPPASQRLREEGTVTLALYVDETGRVRQGKVEKSSGFPLLDESALTTALNSWRFTPGRLGNEPAAMWFRVNVKFECYDAVAKRNNCG